MENEVHPIQKHYDDCRRKQQEAYAELEAARKRGADAKEIKRLEDKALWAGYTGD